MSDEDEIRVPILPLEVDFTVSDGSRLEGTVFLAPNSPRHDGPETLDEFLNAARSFLPVRSGGSFLLLGSDSILVAKASPEAPLLSREQRTLAHSDATLVGVTYLDNSSASEQFARRYHIKYPVLRDVSGSFVRSFGTTGVPETFVINRQGRIQALQRFPVTSQWLSRTLPRILAERS